ncbi:MAG: bifunctional nuclease family protein [Bacteroidota bacterium]|nr:bifunctional nuclease family protein [Bacteroidota bacterium]
MEKRIPLKVYGITISQVETGAYALILGEIDGPRKIPIIVGTPEAQSIVIQLEHITPRRPLTHDLFQTFSQAFGIRLLEVYIYKMVAGVFYAEMLFDNGERQVKIDSRTSDAIAVALRVGCPIYTTELILQEAGVIIEGREDSNEPTEEEEDETTAVQQFQSLSTEELNKRLQEAIDDENYEYASKIRDELKKRGENI